MALAGTIPPYRGRSLSSELDAMNGSGRNRKIVIGAAVAAVVVGIYAVGRDKLPDGNASTSTLTAVIKASAKQEGIKLVVDGKDIGTLPQELKGLAPGEHTVVFEGGERYVAKKTTVTLDPNETKELDPVSLKVNKGAATFDVKTPGATLALVSSDERRALTDYSRPIDIDNSKAWTLEASKPGYKTVKLPVTFDDQAAKTFVVAFDEASKEPVKTAGVDTASPPAETPAVEARPASSKGAKTARAKAKADAAEATKAATAAAPATGNCTLNLNSIPISRVLLDGRPLGLTPKMGVSVTAGPHAVAFIGDRARKSMAAQCKPGETKTVATRL